MPLEREIGEQYASGFASFLTSKENLHEKGGTIWEVDRCRDGITDFRGMGKLFSVDFVGAREHDYIATSDINKDPREKEFKIEYKEPNRPDYARILKETVKLAHSK